MSTINFNVPKSWSELSEQQLQYLFKLLAADYHIDEIKALCLFRWSGARLISRYGDEQYLLKLGKDEFAVTPQQVAEMLTELDWIGQLPQFPIRLPHIGHRHALPADFQGVPFETFLICENLYQGFLHTHQDSFLDELSTHLYPKNSHLLPLTFYLSKLLPLTFYLKPLTRINVFYWFVSLKDFFAKRFPDFFQPLNSDSENLLGSSPNIGAQLQESMDAQIRALTKGDITKEREILALDTWRALTELNAQAKEYRQLHSKFKQ
jgi:hypothetical protein